MVTLCLQDKCKRCDIGYIVKDFVHPLMQAMTVYLKEYNMRLIKTKCLNTSVMFYNLFFGKDAYQHTSYCDVHNVVLRHQSGADNNIDIATRLYKDVTRKTKYRYVYYIMLTDGYFVKPDGSKVFFPGHVFVLEKIPWGDSVHYYMYQSYIQEYDFSGYFEKNNKSIKLSAEKVEYFMKKINDMVNTRIWDSEFVKFWKDMTKVDSGQFVGSSPENAFYVCYRKLKRNDCMKNILTFANKIYKSIPSPEMDDHIYGDPNSFDIDSKPLTNKEMRNAFARIIYRLQNDDLFQSIKK